MGPIQDFSDYQAISKTLGESICSIIAQPYAHFS